MNRKILIFTTRQLCYCSAAFFSARLAEAFENMGDNVTSCELNDETNRGDGAENELSEESGRRLESILGSSFDAVYDFNSRLPRMILDDGSYYLDHINAPFYNYILDHPLYHHSTLSCRLQNYHVIMVDQIHCEYVKKNYPHIRSVICQPLGASEAVCGHDVNNKKNQILFMGTYRDPDQFLDKIRIEDNVFSGPMLSAIDLLLADETLTVEEAMHQVLIRDGVLADGNESRKTDFNFSVWMNRCYLIELFIRNYRRKQALNALISAGLPVMIMGDWWEHYSGIDRSNVIWQQPVLFSQSYEKIAGSSIILDSAPFFTMGVHDRVTAGMANETAVLTDYNPVKQTMPVALYHASEPKSLVDCAEELLINKGYRRDLVDKGYEFYLKHGTWDIVAHNLLKE